MPTRKQPPKPPDPPWQVILEEMRSQNRATVEAVEATREALEHRIDRLEQDTRTRDAALEMAIRELRLDVRQVQGDVPGLMAEVAALGRIEERG